MTRIKKLEIVERLMAAKMSHDIEGLLSIYTPDCLVEQPSLGVRSIGHNALRPGLELFARHFPDYQRRFEGVAEDGNTLCSWGTASFTLTGNLNGHTPNGQKAEIMTFVLFRFAGDQISYEGHFWDLASICRQSGVPIDAFISA